MKGKADLAVVVLLTAKIERLELEIAASKAVDDKLESYKRWAIATAITIISIVVAATGLILKLMPSKG